MHELITRLTEKAGISTEQAAKALDTVKDFVKEKFPMMAGAVDNLFAPDPETTIPSGSITDSTAISPDLATAGVTTAVPDPAAPEVPETSILDKISDVIPGATGQKVEDFVKGAAHKAEDVYENVKEKLGDMFGGDKK